MGGQEFSSTWLHLPSSGGRHRNSVWEQAQPSRPFEGSGTLIQNRTIRLQTTLSWVVTNYLMSTTNLRHPFPDEKYLLYLQEPRGYK